MITTILDTLKHLPAPYPRELFAARRIAYLRQLQAEQESSDGLWLVDPRTQTQKDADEFTNDVLDTRKSDYPI